MYNKSLECIRTIHANLKEFEYFYTSNFIYFIYGTTQIAVQNVFGEPNYVITRPSYKPVWIHKDHIVILKDNDHFQNYIQTSEINEIHDMFQLTLMADYSNITFDDIMKVKEIYQYFRNNENFLEFVNEKS